MAGMNESSGVGFSPAPAVGASPGTDSSVSESPLQPVQPPFKRERSVAAYVAPVLSSSSSVPPLPTGGQVPSDPEPPRERSETDESSDEGDDHQSKTVIDLNPDKKGIEIELRHLQLRENASALLFDKAPIC